ncbi:aspartic proteinase Asp1 [Neltuma alba]|uniref:aspartic proteinase Asp1 n=1 Tax=Neltuma alba TaxID=207710 RepID=UPI0010A52114|nr:aspartic proteinase Asp1-like [Prosopis alba]
MEVKYRAIAMTLFFFLGFSAIFPLCFSDVVQPSLAKKSPPLTSNNRIGSSVVFRVQGNVYPLGYYSVSLNIGNPPKAYDLDIDSGSDLTWVQCDAPCKGCTKPRSQQYKPHKNLVPCGDQLCGVVQSSARRHCQSPNEQCDYEIEYADHGSSMGVLVRDYIPLRLTNGSVVGPRLAFGCGYDQTYSGPTSPPSTAGVLGLGNGKSSLLSQLTSLGVIRNVVGHCLSGRGGGFLFFGDHLVPSSGVSWTPISPGSSVKHYVSGPADLLFNAKTTSVKGLQVIFDSGSSYAYFNSKAYQAIVNTMVDDLKGKPLSRATADRSLPVCWKGSKPFKSVGDVANLFKPLTLSFTRMKNVQLQLPPSSYLILTKQGNVCLGILNGSEAGLGNLNIIGDIFLQDKMVIYDNEKKQIGWIPAKCDKLSKS